ncbi:hypothetical protein A0J61_08818 [Choanephora cucurbitarum]|uniref:Uncharacterized protein n=1 Tax=Choanephora cucurbitarum TaxID=101091 RepID=A0A1C7N2A5_9FUNG|nr:hypothetical protein A0J61_08818 [Choanephora cucurbitarum]
MNNTAFRSLVQAVLSGIDTNRPLLGSSKLENCHQKDALPDVKAFIQDTQTEAQQGRSSPLKYTDPHGSRFLPLLPMYDCTPKQTQVHEQSFRKIIKSVDKEGIDTGKNLMMTLLKPAVIFF